VFTREELALHLDLSEARVQVRAKWERIVAETSGMSSASDGSCVAGPRRSVPQVHSEVEEDLQISFKIGVAKQRQFFPKFDPLDILLMAGTGVSPNLRI
jgi:hypothetical protein